MPRVDLSEPLFESFGIGDKPMTEKELDDIADALLEQPEQEISVNEKHGDKTV